MNLPIIDHRYLSLQQKKSEYQKVHLLNMPKLGINNPPMGPAVIQAITKQMHADVEFLDLNLQFNCYFENSTYRNEILHAWPENGQALTVEQQLEVDQFVHSLDLNQLLDCDVLAMSVFSSHSHRFTEYFLRRVRAHTRALIVIGGAGVAVATSEKSYGVTFGQEMLEQNLIDYYIQGEGELSWRAILSQTLPWPGVNSPGEPLSDFSQVPVPDYSGYQLSQYLNSKVQGLTIGVEGSRGCVRNCTFCDVKSFWKKYKFKDGLKLAQELILLKQQYHVEHFFFNDSLINGSDRAFRLFIQTLAQHNRNFPENIINWSAYYIVKPKNVYKSQDWQDLKDSGVKSLFIGIESGSEQVRGHMKKKFSNADIDFVMTNLQRHGIRCTWLMIIGYPTETQKDFEQTLELLRRYQHMAVDGTIDTVALGLTLGIIKESPLNDMKTELGIHSLVGDYNNGVYWKNDHSDFKTRLMRRIIAEETARELGYNSWVGDMDQIDFFKQKLQEIEQGVVAPIDIASHHG